MNDKSTLKTVFGVASVTIFSRLLALLSTQIYLSAFGAKDVELNIYSYALIMPNIIFTAIGTALTTVIVPIYSSLLAKNETEKSKKFLDDMISISTLLMVLLIIVGLIISPYIVNFSYYKNSIEQFNYAVFALRVLIPVMFFYGLNFIFQGILQSHHKFLLPALVSIPSSLTVIIYVLFLSNKFGVTGLLFATLLGLSLQALFLLPAVLKTGYVYKPSFDFKSEEIRHSLKLTAPVLIGVSAYQINSVFNISMATKFMNVTVLQNVQNIVLTSVLTFIYSVTSVYYPRLSTFWAKKDVDSYKKTLSEIFSGVLFLIIPISFGFVMVRMPFFNLLSKWGKVTTDDINVMAIILSLYAIGIPAMAFKEIIDRAFYAQKQTKVSAIIGFVIMIFNIIFSLSLIKFLGLYALPLSYSLSSTVGVSILLIIMNKKIGHFFDGIGKLTLKCTISAIVMSVSIYGVETIITNIYFDNLIFRILHLFVPVTLGVIVYFATTSLLGVNESTAVINRIRNILKKF